MTNKKTPQSSEGLAETKEENYQDRLTRQLGLLILLLNHTYGLSKQEIFNRIPEYKYFLDKGISLGSVERTFRRDKEYLNQQGFFIDVTSEDKHFIDFNQIFASEIHLTPGEKEVLARAARLWTNGDISATVRSGLLKLDAIADYWDQPAHLSSIHNENFFIITDALAIQKAIEISDTSGTKNFLNPWGFYLNFDQWVIMGTPYSYTEEDDSVSDLVSYALDSIQSVKILDDNSVQAPQELSLEDIQNALEPSQDHKKLTVQTHDFYASLFLEQSPLFKVLNVSSSSPTCDQQMIECSYVNEQLAENFFLRYRHLFTVLEPKQFCSQLADRAQSTYDFQKKVNEDSSITAAHSRKVNQENIPEIMTILAFAILNARGSGTSVEDAVKHAQIDFFDIKRAFHKLNSVESNVDSRINFEYQDPDFLEETNEFEGGPGSAFADLILRLTRWEAAALLLTLRVFETDSIVNYTADEINSARNKIATAAGIDPHVFDKSFISSMSHHNDSAKIQEIEAAIENHQGLTFEYLPKEGAGDHFQKRTIWPLYLHHLNNTWYVYSWCFDNNDTRLFRLDKAHHLRKNQDVTPPDNLSELLDNSAAKLDFESIFGPDKGGQEISIASTEGGKWIHSYHGFKSKSYDKHPFVDHVITFTAYEPETLIPDLLASTEPTAVVDNPELSQKLLKAAEKIIENYTDDGKKNIVYKQTQ